MFFGITCLRILIWVFNIKAWSWQHRSVELSYSQQLCPNEEQSTTVILPSACQPTKVTTKNKDCNSLRETPRIMKGTVSSCLSSAYCRKIRNRVAVQLSRHLHCYVIAILGGTEVSASNFIFTASVVIRLRRCIHRAMTRCWHAYFIFPKLYWLFSLLSHNLTWI